MSFNTEEYVLVPRPLVEALREAVEPRRVAGRDDAYDAARAVVDAVGQAAEGEDERPGKRYIRSMSGERFETWSTPPPVSPPEDDDAGINSREALIEGYRHAVAERDALAAKVRAGLALADKWEALPQPPDEDYDGTTEGNIAYGEWSALHYDAAQAVRAALSDPPAVAEPTDARTPIRTDLTYGDERGDQ